MSKVAARVLLDTNIVIAILRGQLTHIDRFVGLRASAGVALLSPIVVGEVMAGAFEREFAQIEGFFALCEVTSLDGAMARQAGAYACRFRKSYTGIALEDYFVAATANALGCALWTDNRKHFPMTDIAFF